MAWDKTLLDASFRGVRFDVASIGDDIERAVAVHSYPFTDGGDPEDLGREPRRISLKALFYGDDYERALQTFIAAIDTPGAGTLIHPLFGSIRAQFTRAHIEHREDQPDFCEVQLDFVEAALGEPVFSRQLAANKVAAVGQATAATIDRAQTRLAADVAKVLKGPAALQQLVLATMQGAIGKAMSLYQTLSQPITGALALVTSTLNYLSFPFTFVRDLQASFAARVGALFGAASAFGQLAQAGFSLASMWSGPVA